MRNTKSHVFIYLLYRYRFLGMRFCPLKPLVSNKVSLSLICDETLSLSHETNIPHIKYDYLS